MNSVFRRQLFALASIHAFERLLADALLAAFVVTVLGQVIYFEENDIKTY